MFTLYHIKRRKHTHHTLGVPNLAKNSWLDVTNPSDDEIKTLSKRLGITTVELKHALDEREHPRLVQLKHFTQIVLKIPYVSQKRTLTTSCAFFINKDVLVSLHKKKLTQLDNIVEEFKNKTIIVESTGQLVCEVLEDVIRKFYTTADVLEDHLEELEDQVLENPTDRDLFQELFTVKKALIYFYKSLTANREVILALQKSPHAGFTKNDLNHLERLYHDTIQLIDILETMREIITSTIEIHVSGVSNKLNETMKTLTIYGSVVLIPTLIASIYGMNFDFMPELHWRYGYPFSLGIMLVSVIAIYLFFKRSRWV